MTWREWYMLIGFIQTLILFWNDRPKDFGDLIGTLYFIPLWPAILALLIFAGMDQGFSITWKRVIPKRSKP
jgi:hypothetical protein